ncbi:MAG: radical SAM/SPASM domain-containing protein [Nitrosotalea sp.]
MKINKGQFRLTSRSKNFKFDLHRGKGHLISYISNRIKWHLYPRIHHVSKFPPHVDVEISSTCDLNCPMCYTTTEEFKQKVNRGFMDFELFKKIIDECVKYNLYSIRISLRGEPFIHPNVFDMIKYAKEKGIKEVASLTHGGRLDEQKFEKLIDLGLDWLTISFDGIGETYEKIRHPLKFNDQVEKIRKFQEIKKRRGSVKPVIKVQTVWPAISKNPAEFYNIFNPITDQVASNPLIDYLRNDTEVVYEKNFTCPQLWERMVIGSDGGVMLCGNDEMGAYKVGNANEESLYKIWHGKKMNEARDIHMRHMGVKEINICKHCYLPRATEKDTSQVENRTINIDNYVNREQTVGK